MRKKHILLLAFVGLLSLHKAGNIEHPSFVSSNDVFGTRVFVENKGQFDAYVKFTDKVHYAIITSAEKIFFTGTGVVHQFTKTFPLKEKHEEAKEKGAHVFRREPEVYNVKMNWLNANENIQIESSEKQSHYFTFWKADLVSNTYKKITYKNVYDHIDIEYVIPSDKTQGVKYTVILHPGANPEDIKISYSGDVDKIKLNNSGEVIIKSPLEDLIEHLPVSFYSDKQKVNSRFVLKNNILSFEFPDKYDVNKTLYVDPWVTTVTTLTTNNSAYDVDYDDNGNVFIYGGVNDYKVAKYNAAGVLQWTFAGFLTVPAWNSSDISNFVVIRSNGKSYVGQGYTGSVGARIIRLDANGIYDNLITPAASSWNEVWDLAYHCSTGNVYGMGGSTASNHSAGIIDQTTGNLTPTNFIGVFNTTDVGNDVANYAIDDAGEFFWIYASNFTPSLNNVMAKINAAFTTTLWVGPSGFNTLNEYVNKQNYVPTAGYSNGYNCLAVNNSYLYFYDGKNVAAYNKATGAQIANTIISSHSVLKYGGIAVDDCNNLYLGGQDTIKSMHFNGTGFTPLPHILVGASSSTNSAVYDLKLDRFTKTLYASGAGFVGVYGPSNTSTCTPLNIICYNPNPQSKIICAGTSITLTPVNFLNLTNPTYSVNPGPLSNATGTFVVTPLSNVNYTTYVIGTTTNNVAVTLTAVVNVTVNPQPVSVPSVTQAGCTNTVNGFNLNLSFIPPTPVPSYSIAWSPVPSGILTNVQTSVTGGNIPGGVYNATITAANGCKTYPSFTINGTPEQAVFIISPNAPYSISCFSPSLSLDYLPATFNYTTNNNIYAPIIGPNAVFTSSISGGTWTVTAVHPVSGCVSTQTFAITNFTAVPNSTLSPTFQNITCSVTSIQPVIAIADPTVNVTHYFYSPLGGSVNYPIPTATFVPGGPGTYTHCVTDDVSGCSTCKMFTVTSSDGFPTYSVTSPQNFTLGCTTKSTAVININNAQTTPSAGAVSYTILGPPTSTNYVTGTLSSYTVSVPGTWTVITKDNANFCETKVQISVMQNTFAPHISAIVPQQILSCFVPSVVLVGVSNTPNVDYNWSFPGTPGNVAGPTVAVNVNSVNASNTLIANYTLTVTDMGNTCRSSSVITMNQNIFKPNAAIAGGNQISCLTQTITLTNNSSTNIPPVYPSNGPVVGYLWEGPTPQEPVQLSTTYVAAMPGTYTITAKDMNNGCTAVGTKTIDDFRDYPYVNKPNGTAIFTLDCGANNITIYPTVDPPTTGFTYTWLAPPSFTTSSKFTPSLTVEDAGIYQILVENTLNGCASTGVVSVVNGNLKGDFAPSITKGFAPMEVVFTNNSKSTLDNNKITSVWNFGNGISTITYSAIVQPTIAYTQPGTYTVTMYVTKGDCMDTVTKYVSVDIPSHLVVPNIFTPNGDGANDVFFLRASNQEEITMTIIDRWGKTVYDVVSVKGNMEWDGKNKAGRECPDGVYSYTLKTRGTDGIETNTTGTITLVR